MPRRNKRNKPEKPVNACRKGWRSVNHYSCVSPTLGTAFCAYYTYTAPLGYTRSPKAAHYCDKYILRDGSCFNQDAIAALQAAQEDLQIKSSVTKNGGKDGE